MKFYNQFILKNSIINYIFYKLFKKYYYFKSILVTLNIHIFLIINKIIMKLINKL